MGMVTFFTPPLRNKLVVKVQPQAQRTLLSLMREHNLPRQCTCGEGKCGACAVKVARLHKFMGSRTVRLNDLERQVLFSAGKISREEYESEVLPDTPPRWRLACQYVVADEEVVVAF